MEKIIELQKKLDEKKYFQSQTARQDLSGRMAYCNTCYFLKFDQEKGHLICNLDEKARVENQVCAKNYLRGQQDDSGRIETKKVNGKPRTTRKTSNGKS